MNIMCISLHGRKPQEEAISEDNQPCALWFPWNVTPTTNRNPEKNETPISPADTRREITKLSARGYVTIRSILVQLPDDHEIRSSTVGWAMSNRKRRELVLYLLLLTCWPWLQKREEPLDAKVWLRALEGSGPQALTWSASSLSRAWNALEKQGLITRTREGQKVRVIPCREDGICSLATEPVPYSSPTGQRDRYNTYFILPDAFWHDELFAKLKLPGIVMLLIIAKETSQKNDVWLSLKEIQRWYGVSQSSAQEGIKQLGALGLVEQYDTWVSAPLSPLGKTARNYYRLTAEFSQSARSDLQQKTKASRDTRLASVSKRNR